MGEDFLDYIRIFDTGDNTDAAAAMLAGLDLDIENPFEPLCPGHGSMLFRESPFLGVCPRSLAALAPFRRGDLRPVFADRCEDAVVAGQVDVGPGHECGQLGQEIQWVEDDMGGAVPVGRFQSVSNISVRCQRQALYCPSRRRR